MTRRLRSCSRQGESIAAVFSRPIRAEAGLIIPPAGYLKAVRKLCDKYVSDFFDEIQQAWPPGRYFRCCEEDVTPDIMTYGRHSAAHHADYRNHCPPKMWVEELKENRDTRFPDLRRQTACISAALPRINFMVTNDVPKLRERRANSS
jgi:putrescine aminotransferase